MKINLSKLPVELKNPSQRLGEILDFACDESGIEITASEGDKIIVDTKNNKCHITYVKKNTFFRALGILVENLKKTNEFYIEETPAFDTVGVMLNATSGVYTVEGLKNFIHYLAVMGYNMIQMYTEYTFDVKTRPFFGYMSGKYTEAELRECDDYAYEYGIEMVPCIQTFGHLSGYLRWPEAKSYTDTAAVLMADNEETYKFLNEVISAATMPYRSNRIHLGMDEAWDMVRGKFMDRFGFVNPFELFTKHLMRVVDITNKYGLIPMIWSDMFFRINEPDHLYYEKETIIPEDVKSRIPEEVQLVYWHYGEKYGCDEYMIKKHLELNRDCIFAGGLWDWTGHMPENYYALDTARLAINACRKYGIREMMTTKWSCTVDPYCTLLGLSFNAELCYKDNPDDKILKERFEACTGGIYEAFFDMSAYHNIFDDGRQYPDYNDRFMGMPLFWQDILEGLHDKLLYDQPMSDHYRKYADKMKEYSGRWNKQYRYAEAIFEYLHTKTYIAENIKNAYDKGDKETLKVIADILLPKLKLQTNIVHKMHEKLWLGSFKAFGFAAFTVRYAGIEGRCDFAINRINDYLKGEIKQIEELEVERLDIPKSGFWKFPHMTI